MGVQPFMAEEHIRYCGLFSGRTRNTWHTLQPKLLDNYLYSYFTRNYKCSRAPHILTAAGVPRF